MVKRLLPLLAAFLVAPMVGVVTARAADYNAPPQAAAPAGTEDRYIVVTAPEADVVSAPGDGATVLLKAFKGAVFPLKGEQAGWYAVATGQATTGWISRESAALMYFPEFLDPVRLREAYTPPPYVPRDAWGYGDWWDGGTSWTSPWLSPWRDPLWWGLGLSPYGWYGGGHRYDRDYRYDRYDRHRDRPRNRYPSAPVPPPHRDPRHR